MEDPRSDCGFDELVCVCVCDTRTQRTEQTTGVFFHCSLPLSPETSPSLGVTLSGSARLTGQLAARTHRSPLSSAAVPGIHSHTWVFMGELWASNSGLWVCTGSHLSHGAFAPVPTIHGYLSSLNSLLLTAHQEETKYCKTSCSPYRDRAVCNRCLESCLSELVKIEKRELHCSLLFLLWKFPLSWKVSFPTRAGWMTDSTWLWVRRDRNQQQAYSFLTRLLPFPSLGEPHWLTWSSEYGRTLGHIFFNE